MIFDKEKKIGNTLISFGTYHGNIRNANKNALRKLDWNKCTSIGDCFKLGTKFNNF
jgi:hypothetical protein